MLPAAKKQTGLAMALFALPWSQKGPQNGQITCTVRRMVKYPKMTRGELKRLTLLKENVVYKGVKVK